MPPVAAWRRAWWVLALAAAAGVLAHPAHVSLAEVDWNPGSRRLEVALRIDPADLALALGGRPPAAGRDDPELAELVRRHFRVHQGEEPLPLDWIGSESDGRAAWLYFEVAVPAGTARLRIGNTLLFDRHERQLNTVNFRSGGEVTTLHLSRDRPDGQVTLPEP